jgi:hypothetical protein
MVFDKEDQKLTVEQFRGLYDRGNPDEVPLDHAQDCLNVIYTTDGFLRTREGLKKAITLPQNSGMRRFFVMTAQPANIGETGTGDPGASDGDSLLWLDNSNHLYIGNNTTPLYTLGGMADFSALNAGNRTYVSPNSGAAGVLKGKLQVVNPLTGSTRDAGGHAPEQSSGSSLAAANGVDAGNVAAGVHKIAVLYETETGFWTPPGPKIIMTCTPTAGNPTVFHCNDHGMVTGESHRIAQSGSWGTPFSFSDTWHITRIDDDYFSVPVDSSGFGAVTGSFGVAAEFRPASVTSDGTHKIDITAIPVGGSFIKRRIIIATRADEEEFFFVPNVPGSQSEIGDNTTTSCSINFDDTDLVDSADYLFDLLEAIPGGSHMCKYRNRLILVGPYIPGLQERVLVSNIGDFETFNWVSGYIQVQNERDNNDVFSCFVLRDTLYLAKFVGLFAVEDNGDNPSTWKPTIIDGVVGCYAHGLSNFSETQAAPDTGDIVLLASKSGLYMFDGVIRRPELSWKIQALWDRITPTQFFRVTVAHDPWRHRIYVSVPLDGASDPTHLLVCDYTDGRTADRVRWSVFTFHKNPSVVGMVYFGSSEYTSQYTLKLASIQAGSLYLYSLDATALNDDGTLIDSHYTPGKFSFGGVGCFKNLHWRASGVGRLTLTLYNVDHTANATPPYLTLSTTPGRELDRQINFVSEKMSVKFRNNTTLNDYMMVDRLDVWGNMLWPIRPSV